jgi:hypothetical protein
MPKFGDSNARAGKPARPSASAKTGHRKGASAAGASKFKPREDGRGGRSDFRAAAADDRGPRKPRAAKGAPTSRWEDRAPRTFDRDNSNSGDSRKSRPAGSERSSAPARGSRDWSPTPPARRSNFQRDDRAPRNSRRPSTSALSIVTHARRSRDFT